jgi:hypothetical protein
MPGTAAPHLLLDQQDRDERRVIRAMGILLMLMACD